MEVQSDSNAERKETLVAQPNIFKEVHHWEVDCQDLNELIQKELGIKDFEFVAAEECGNDSQHTMTAEIVTDEFWWGVHKENLEKCKAGKWVYETRTLLNELVMQKKILPGKYLVNVSW